MGDVAEMMIDGTLCQYCGVLLGEAVGYPRSCGSCDRSQPGPKRQRQGKAGGGCNKGLICPVCKRKFRHERDLDRHSVQKHGTEPKTRHIRRLVAEGKVKKGNPDGKAH